MEAALVIRIRQLVADLAAGRYAEIVADGRAGQLDEEQLRRAIDEYGRQLLPLPDEAITLIAVYPYDADPNGCALDVTLWTVEEGASDLTLSLSATKVGDGLRLEIEDLHVL